MYPTLCVAFEDSINTFDPGYVWLIVNSLRILKSGGRLVINAIRKEDVDEYSKNISSLFLAKTIILEVG